MKLKYASRSHVGMKRTHNEDNFLIVPEENLFIVADGMGGHASGEVASQVAVDTILKFFKEIRSDSQITWPYKLDSNYTYDENKLIAGIKLANQRIYELALSNINYKGMGTTIVSLYRVDGECFLCHVGDSRAYLMRDGKLRQLTEDHSLLNDYKKVAQLTEEEIKNFPHKNIIVRALGMKESVEVDKQKIKLQQGDIFLLCTDGLTGELDDSEISQILLDLGDDLEKACDALIEKACGHGGRDNITAILLKVE